jgi:hypothetical protein
VLGLQTADKAALWFMEPPQLVLLRVSPRRLPLVLRVAR